MAWVMRKRNVLISGVSDNARNWLAAYHIKLALVAAGWTLQGSGYGAGGASGVWDAGVLDRWATVPTRDLCWVGLQNGDGVQLILKCNAANLEMYWLKGAVYTSGTETTIGIPNRGAVPANEISTASGVYSGVPTSNIDFYLQVATEGTDSFWAWSKNALTVSCCTALVKLTETKAADVNPYWSYRYGHTSTSAFGGVIDTAADATFCLHPTAGVKKIYPVLRYKVGGLFASAALPVDPNSGKEQLLETMVGCTTAGFIHLKGKLPGLRVCSSMRTVGDTFASSTYVCVSAVSATLNGYALPWDASGGGML
jgi:hypothetical protein